MKKILKFIKFTLILLILFSIYFFVCAYNYVSAVSSELSDSVFRLHVIANNDSEEDQNLKYIVRDNLLNYMNNICKDCSSKEEAITIANNNIDTFKSIAEQTIIEQGFNYPVSVEIGNFEFPTKYYGDISLPSGYYDALRVKIGNASGKNWWCVMFPPLCFIDISSGVVPDESKEVLKDSLDSEEYALISDTKSNEITFKFKILEFFNTSNFLTAKNN